MQKIGWKPVGYQEVLPLRFLKCLLQDTSAKDQWKTKDVSTCHRLQTDLFLKMTPGNFPFDCRKEVWTDPKALRNYEVDLGRI